jgi:serine/threonine protein kinase
MSAQTINDAAVAPIWSGWQNAIINGVYPLQRLLSGSERGAVFLTERKGQVVCNAAVKIIPVERVTLAQLSHWRLTTGLLHPHLIQLFDAGLCQLGGRQFLFVVMEYAEQTLAQVLGQRALTADEVREMLPPTLEALSFLHRKGLVHGQLKPANILVVNDQLKLASDSVRPAGAARVAIAESSMYDPPQASDAAFSSADDLWGLGVTLVEALTQSLPWHAEQSDTVCLPTTIPPEFLETVQRCLSYNPAGRPLATELEAQLGRAPKAPEAPMVPMVPVPPESPRRHGLVPRLAAIGSVLILAAIWAGWQLFRTHSNAQQSTSVTGKTASQQPAVVPAIASQNPAAQRPGPTSTVSSVIHVQLPNVPRKALGTIHGHFRIAVLVVVDHSGTPTRALLKNTGPSPYFARLALDAAMKSRFAPADPPRNREWLLRFEFTRSGVSGGATPGS